jgi:hypothetical protein
VHFGLVSATGVEKLEIQWPNGASETISVPGIDRKLTVIEGTGIGTKRDIAGLLSSRGKH